jgi:hypothetical protein
VRWLKASDAITRQRYFVNVDRIWEIGVELYHITPEQPAVWCLMIRFQNRRSPSTLKMYTDCGLPTERCTREKLEAVQDCIGDLTTRWTGPPILDLNKIAASL